MFKARCMPVKEGTAQLKFNRAGANYLKKKIAFLCYLLSIQR